MKVISYLLLVICAAIMAGCASAPAPDYSREYALRQFDDLSRQVVIEEFSIDENFAFFRLSEPAQIYYSAQYDGPWIPPPSIRRGNIYLVDVPVGDTGYFVAMKGADQ